MYGYRIRPNTHNSERFVVEFSWDGKFSDGSDLPVLYPESASSWIDGECTAFDMIICDMTLAEDDQVFDDYLKLRDHLFWEG